MRNNMVARNIHFGGFVGYSLIHGKAKKHQSLHTQLLYQPTQGSKATRLTVRKRDIQLEQTTIPHGLRFTRNTALPALQIQHAL